MSKAAEAKLLGKKVTYPHQYDPSVLVKVERRLNREQYDIEEKNLPFTGIDVWNAYEVSFLTKKGLPVTGVLKIVYPASSKYIVESKSLKLYLNSFNMSRYGETEFEGLHEVSYVIEHDLSELLKTRVMVNWFTEAAATDVIPYQGYQDICELINLDEIEFTAFKETPELLQVEENAADRILKIKTNLLRSNCKVTHQPDWGTLYLYMESSNFLDLKSLAQYIVSFRNENHFHEEVVEMIYKRLYDIVKPKELMVGAIYTRRGGIDICPCRANRYTHLDEYLINANVHCMKDFRQ